MFLRNCCSCYPAKGRRDSTYFFLYGWKDERDEDEVMLLCKFTIISTFQCETEWEGSKGNKWRWWKRQMEYCILFTSVRQNFLLFTKYNINYIEHTTKWNKKWEFMWIILKPKWKIQLIVEVRVVVSDGTRIRLYNNAFLGILNSFDFQIEL